MSAALNGSWILEKSENFDEVMKELGVGFVLRKVGNTVTPTFTFTNDGSNKWNIKMTSTFKNEDDTFNLNEEFDKDTTDGRKVKQVFKKDGDKLISEQRDRKTGELQVVATRYVTSDDKMIEEVVVKNVKAVRTYKRV